MSKTTKTIIWLIVAIIIITGIWWGVSRKPAQPPTTEKEVIKIGVIAPLSGDAVEYGNGAKTGYELALKEVNEGGVNGRKIQLLYEDGKCEAAAAVNAVNKLINIDKVKVILGGVCSSETLAAAPIAEKNKVIMLSSISTNYQITETGDYIFRNIASDALQGKKAAEWAYNHGFKKVAILYITTNDYGPGLEKVFREEISRLGGEVVISDGFAGGDTDFRTQLTKIKNKNPQAIFLAGMLKEDALILNQARELGITAQFIATESIKDPSLFDVAKDSAEGVVFTTMHEIESEKAKAFKSLYSGTYGKEPKFYSDYAYDALKLLAEVMKQCSNPEDTECIKNGLYNIRYEGATGLNDFDENGDVSKPFDVYKIQNGKFVPYKD